MVEPHWTGTAHLFRDCYINSINIENRHDLNDTDVLTEESRIESQTVNTEETPNEHTEEERSQSDDNEHETHLVEPTSREATITTTEETRNEELRKINTVCIFYKKMACRHGMIGEECKFLHPPPCRKYMENPERCCRAQCKGYYPELCKYSRATRECYNDRCFRIHLKGTRRKQTTPATQEPITTPRTTNQQQAMIKTQNLAYNRPPPLLTFPTQHTTATHHAPSPTHYHTPPATQYLTTHQTRFTVPQSPTTPCYPVSNQPILNPY